MIVLALRSNVNEINPSFYWNTIVYDEAYYNATQGNPPATVVNLPRATLPQFKGKNIIAFSASESVGQNTVIITGEFELADKSKVSYETQFPRESKWYTDNFGQFLEAKGIKTAYDNAYLPTTPQGKLESDSLLGVASAQLGKKPPLNSYSVSDRNYVPFWESLLVQLIPWLLIIGLLGFVFFRMMKAQSGAGGLSIFNAGKNRAKKSISNVRFVDIAGIDDEKDELTELVDYLKNPQKYSVSGARIPKGILLEGPPGTGKTLLAKAVSGEAGVPFYSVSGSEFEEIFVGVGASRIREMFRDAKKSAPCIIFIDEIDAVGRKRAASFGGATNEQTLNQLLVELDGFEENSGIIVIAATNMVDLLDRALLRPGRFDRKIQIGLPDFKARAAILRLHARNKNISAEIDFERLAQRTPGFSGAQLENVLNEAAILSIRTNSKLITLEIIDEAIDRVVGGAAKKSKEYTLRDKNIVSMHEAGHALIGMKVSDASKVQKVTIIPRGSAGGYTIVTPSEEIMFYSKEHLISNITGFLGGRAAEEIVFGANKVTTGAHDDLEKATYTARHMVTEFGMSKLGLTQFESRKQQSMPAMTKQYSEGVAKAIDDEINTILNDCYAEALKIIKANLDELKLIALALFTMETITAEDIEYMDQHMKLPPRIQKEKEYQDNLSKKRSKGDIIDIKPESTVDKSKDKK